MVALQSVYALRRGIMATRTPINWIGALQEYAHANRRTVQYSETAAIGRSSGFTVRVRLLCEHNLEAVGVGNTKSAAKCKAAQELMSLVTPVDRTPRTDIPTSVESQGLCKAKTTGENVIGELQVNWVLTYFIHFALLYLLTCIHIV